MLLVQTKHGNNIREKEVYNTVNISLETSVHKSPSVQLFITDCGLYWKNKENVNLLVSNELHNIHYRKIFMPVSMENIIK